MFLFKSNEITVDCFTPHYDIYESYRPLSSSHFIPDEWKRLPKTIDSKIVPNSKVEIPRGTLKVCKGFTNLFSSGFILQSWTDIILDARDEPMSKFAATNFIMFDSHPKFQLWDGLYDGYKHVKISSPWVLVEKSGVKFTWNRCDWHNTENADKMHMVSAVIDFKYQHHTNMNMFVKNDSVIRISAGQPLVHLIPITDKKVKLKYHIISQQEYDTKFNHMSKFIGRYKESVRINNSKSSCPFGFGK